MPGKGYIARRHERTAENQRIRMQIFSDAGWTPNDRAIELARSVPLDLLPAMVAEAIQHGENAEIAFLALVRDFNKRPVWNEKLEPWEKELDRNWDF